MNFKRISVIIYVLITFLSCSNDNKYTNYEHYQTLDFSYFGYGLEILAEPLSKEVIYTVQKGDVLQTTEFRVYKNGDCYLKVNIPSGESGYVNFGQKNVYENKKKAFVFLENVTIEGKKLWVLSFDAKLAIGYDYLYSLPSEKSEIIHKFTEDERKEYFYAVAITNDFEWIKFNIGEFSGWVHKSHVYVDRGGYAYWTPAHSIQEELINRYNPDNEI